MSSRNERALELRNQTIAANVGRLFQMLIDIYGVPELHNLENIVKKREGQVVNLEFKPLNATVSFVLSKSRLSPHLGKSDKAAATVILNMKKEDLIPSFIDFIKTKDNFFGFLKNIFKYYIPGKIKVKGSLGAGITLWKLLFIGKHSMYKNKR